MAGVMARPSTQRSLTFFLALASDRLSESITDVARSAGVRPASSILERRSARWLSFDSAPCRPST